MAESFTGGGGITRYERIKAMSIEQMAAKIIWFGICTDFYCKSDCMEDCRRELECCLQWLNEEVGRE